MRLELVWLVFEAVVAYFYVLKFGFGSLVLECILSGLLGFVLAFKFGLSSPINHMMFYGIRDIFSSLGYGIAGILLIIPGLISDTIGVFIAIICLIMGKSDRNNSRFYTQDSEQFFNERKRKSHDDGEIIDVEIVEENRGLK